MTALVQDIVAECLTWTGQNRPADRLRGLMRDAGCLVYGAGGYGRQVAASLVDRGFSMLGFIYSVLLGCADGDLPRGGWLC